MRRSETSSIKDLIELLMKKYGADKKIAENKLIRGWEDLLGKSVGKYTRNLYVKNRKLYVSVSSSIVKVELNLIRDQLTKRLNEKAGGNIIDDIVLK